MFFSETYIQIFLCTKFWVIEFNESSIN